MTKTARNILRGVGSVLDIAPAQEYQQFVPEETPEERLRGHFEQVGQSIRNAIEHFAREEEEKN